VTRLIMRSRTDAGHLAALAHALIIAALIIALLIAGREILEPLVIAALLAFILSPLIRRLRQSGVGRIPSVVLAVLFALGTIGALSAIIGLQVTQLAQLVLHRVQVELLVGGQAAEDVLALLDEMRETRFNRLKMFLCLLPLLERQAESIQLRFEFGETLFEVRTLLMHLPPCARDCCTKMRAPRVVFALRCAVHTPRKR